MAAKFKRPFYADKHLNDAFEEWFEAYLEDNGKEPSAYWIRRQMKNIRSLSRADKLTAIYQAVDNRYASIVAEGMDRIERR